MTDPAPSPATIRSVAVFMGTSEGSDPAFAAGARELGRELAMASLDVYFGGNIRTGLGKHFSEGFAQGLQAKTGLEEEFGDQPRWRWPLMHGIVPSVYWDQVAAGGGRPAHVTFKRVASISRRLQNFYDKADAFIALPGSDGTFSEATGAAEYCSSLTYQNPVPVIPPVVALNINGVFDGWMMQRDRFIRDGFAKASALSLVAYTATPGETMDFLRHRNRNPVRDLRNLSSVEAKA